MVSGGIISIIAQSVIRKQNYMKAMQFKDAQEKL